MAPGPPKNIESVAGTSGFTEPGTDHGTTTKGMGTYIRGGGPYWKFQEHVVTTVLSLGARKKLPLVFVCVVGGGGIGLTIDFFVGSAGGIFGNSISPTGAGNTLPPLLGVTRIPCGSVFWVEKRRICRSPSAGDTKNCRSPDAPPLVVQLSWSLLPPPVTVQFS
jgi:hypothetical protein